MYCIHCGNALPDNANFCQHCGTALHIPQETHPLLKDFNPSTHVIQKPKRSKKPFVISGICVLVLLIILSPFIIGAIADLFTPKTNNYYTAEDVAEACIKSIIKNDTETFSIAIYPPILNEYKAAHDYNNSDVLKAMRNNLSEIINLSTLKYRSFDVTYISFWYDDTDKDAFNKELAELNDEYKDSDGYIRITSGADLEGTVRFENKYGEYFTLGWYADVVCADGHYYILDFEFELFNN